MFAKRQQHQRRQDQLRNCDEDDNDGDGDDVLVVANSRSRRDLILLRYFYLFSLLCFLVHSNNMNNNVSINSQGKNNIFVTAFPLQGIKTVSTTTVANKATKYICHDDDDNEDDVASSLNNRRTVLSKTALIVPTFLCSVANAATPTIDNVSDNSITTNKNSVTNGLIVVNDPNTYTALAYQPPVTTNDVLTDKKKITSSSLPASSPPVPPLILVLHGAGRNNLDIMSDLANPLGEHAGLIPSLIQQEFEKEKNSISDNDAASSCPATLLEQFAILAPYSYGTTSFYDDSRQKLLNFIDWAIMNQGKDDVCPIIFDPKRIILFGFSDGATVGVELLTTRRFIGGVICSYGYSGMTLPTKAIQRLSDIPMWIFHSADDVIFNVQNSDRLVQQLRRQEQEVGQRVLLQQDSSSSSSSSIIRYSRYDTDPEQLPSRIRGHSMGITASKSSQVYDWMLQLPPLS